MSWYVQSNPDGGRLLTEVAEFANHGRPSPVHIALAKLAPKAIVTTNYDSLIEKAIRETGATPAVLADNESAEPVRDESIQVFKIFGSIEQPHTLAFSVSESLLGPRRESYLAGRLKTMMALSLVIVIGFEPSSNMLGWLYERLGGAARSSWFIVSGINDPVSETLWASRGVRSINVRDADLGQFFEALRDKRTALLGKPRQHAGQRRQIFVSHTANDPAASTVRRSLRSLGYRPVGAEDVLAGQTWIERLDDLAESSDAAVVILGPESSEGRIRSNVIFELGLLIGKLGRNRVLAVVTRDATPPSDLGSYQYLVLDSDRDASLGAELGKWTRSLGLADTE
jgi:hypothetical protein